MVQACPCAGGGFGAGTFCEMCFEMGATGCLESTRFRSKQELGSLNGSLPNSKGPWFTEAGHKRGGIRRAGGGRCCGFRAQAELLCLTLGITQLIHPGLSVSVSVQHLPPPCQALFTSERSGCKKVGWHQPAAEWMPLEMPSSTKAQLCYREDLDFKA